MALEQWLHIFGLLTVANPQHYLRASKHLPFSFELQMHYGQFGSAVPLQRPRFVMVSAGCHLVTSALVTYAAVYGRSRILLYPEILHIPPQCRDI